MDNLATEWKIVVTKKPKLQLHNDIKTDFGPEKYLTLNIDKYEKSLLSQLRYGILPLCIETGRYNNERREERVCTLCNDNNIESVEHFLFDCSKYDTQRVQFVHKARDKIADWDNLTQTECLANLFCKMPRALGKFVKDIFLCRRNTLYK